MVLCPEACRSHCQQNGLDAAFSRHFGPEFSWAFQALFKTNKSLPPSLTEQMLSPRSNESPEIRLVCFSQRPRVSIGLEDRNEGPGVFIRLTFVLLVSNDRNARTKTA
jgi:hypothetical protein